MTRAAMLLVAICMFGCGMFGCGMFGCGGSDDGRREPAPDDAAGCERECVAGWWFRRDGACTGICRLDPAIPECADDDCELLAAFYYDPDGQLTVFNLSHSPARRTFTRLAALDEPQPWSVDERGCVLIQGAGSAEFTCGTEGLRTDTSLLTRLSADLAAALESTLVEEGTVVGEY